MPYTGRLAPSPTGLLHLGHAATFFTAYQRAQQHHGTLLLRNEDLDPQRSRPEYVEAMLEDLAWLGIRWTPPMLSQSERLPAYRAAFDRLLAAGLVYPCTCSRRDLALMMHAPHEDGAHPNPDPDSDDEPIYTGRCRPTSNTSLPNAPTFQAPHPNPKSPTNQAPHPDADSPTTRVPHPREARVGEAPTNPAPPQPFNPQANYRFRVPDNELIHFHDLNLGPQSFRAGCDHDADFGDFLVWRRPLTASPHDLGLPSYQLACVLDDAFTGITEVVRGADLLKSTARQILLQRALGLPPVDYFHTHLLRDSSGVRLAKRHEALAIRTLRSQGLTPTQVLALTHP